MYKIHDGFFDLLPIIMTIEYATNKMAKLSSIIECPFQYIIYS